MLLKNARKLAIEEAKELPDGRTMDVYRIKKREFIVASDKDEPPGNDLVLVFVAHATWAKNGRYEKYHPEWTA